MLSFEIICFLKVDNADRFLKVIRLQRSGIDTIKYHT